MPACRHRKRLDHTVNKLNEMIRLLTELQVLLFGPSALKREQIEFEPGIRLRQFQIGVARCNAHLSASESFASLSYW